MPPPPHKLPAHGGPRLAPLAGAEGQERGAVSASPLRPATCGAGSPLSAAGIPQPPTLPGDRLASAGLGQQPPGPAATERDQLSGPKRQRLCLDLGPGPLSCPHWRTLALPTVPGPTGVGFPVRCCCSPGLKMKGSGFFLLFLGKRTCGSCEVSPLESPPTRFSPHR